jgi:L-iditol 2-dehydrogenase
MATMPSGEIEKNLAVYTNPAHDLRVIETDIPEPKDDEVIVHVKATGICGRYFSALGHV